MKKLLLVLFSISLLCGCASDGNWGVFYKIDNFDFMIKDGFNNESSCVNFLRNELKSELLYELCPDCERLAKSEAIYSLYCKKIEDISELNCFYGHDGTNVYYLISKNSKPVLIDNADAESFEVFTTSCLLGGNETPKAAYAKDDNSVYYRGELINGANPKTFKILDWKINDQKLMRSDDDQKNHAIDDKKAYFKGVPIIGSNPETYEVLHNFYSKDKENIYNSENTIEEADYDTFEVLSRCYAKDKNYIYCNGEPLEEADYDTFEVEYVCSAFDKNNKYSYCNI